MDINKEKIAHEKHLLSQGVDFKYLPNIQYNELENVYELIEWDEEYSEALNEINSSWCTWQAAKAQAVPEGFVLVKADNVNSFYQDDNEPENFCNSCDDLNALGDLIDRDEIMIVNKHTSAHISTEKFYGAWGVIETSYGTAWKFKLFNTENEARSAIVEAQEPAND